MPNTAIGRFKEYFTAGLVDSNVALAGTEVETSFLDESGAPISFETSQRIFRDFADRGWMSTTSSRNVIEAVTDRLGNRLRYDVARQNLEIAAVPTSYDRVVPECTILLEQLYEVAAAYGAHPARQPILDPSEDLLVVANDFDLMRIEMDGREARNLLARMSSVQFTINVPATEAIRCVNNLGASIEEYLGDYPQNALWRKYVSTSKAGYRSDRYGGPLLFEDLDGYCGALATHDAVQGAKLVPCNEVPDLDVARHIRLVWWHFRLRRYSDRLCIETRPQARRADEKLSQQLDLVLDTLAL